MKLSLGVGQGGCDADLRFGAAEGREAELEKYLRHTALPPLADIVQVTGVHLAIADQAGSSIETAEKKGRPVDGIPSWLMMIEAARRRRPTRRATSCSAAISTQARREGRSMERGLYPLQYCRMKTPGWA